MLAPVPYHVMHVAALPRQVVVTNTIPLGNKLDNASCSKISQISIAPLLAEAVLRVIEQGSLQDLRVFDRENIHERYAGQGKE